ncbi:GFA family protein [Seohaeicola saemankumensis]|nr:GFA family protein [Seohaeicola saemankumensis]MCA0872914.1 GFA family protein [Seohaeicola saemankumensis]
MALTGGCYCGALRYEAAGDAMMKAQCHCRECQYFSGGGANYFMILPEDGFTYVKGTPAQFTRSDLDKPVTREFCPTCGTHILTRLPDRPLLVLKAGPLDDAAAGYGGPAMAIYTVDQQPFHLIAEGLPQFERLPPRG